MKTKIKITNDEIRDLLGSKSYNFPKYSTQLLNLANQNAQATRPAVVGQMSELINEFPGKTIEEWEGWYLEKEPDAIKKAKDKIQKMINNFKDVINNIDEELIEKWVYDLVIIKTFIGLKFQAAILSKIADILNEKYRLATIDEEAQGIDGYIGNIPVSIKPVSYISMKQLNEHIDVKIIYYTKVKNGINIDFKELIKQ